jgi:hypothetical protein
VVNGVHPKGFRGLRQSLVFLVDALNRKTKLFELAPEEQWLAQTYLPQIASELSPDDPETVRAALEEFVSVWEAVGTAKFKQILAATPVEAISKLLNGFLRVSPTWFQVELARMRERCWAEAIA